MKLFTQKMGLVLGLAFLAQASAANAGTLATKSFEKLSREEIQKRIVQTFQSEYNRHGSSLRTALKPILNARGGKPIAPIAADIVLLGSATAYKEYCELSFLPIRTATKIQTEIAVYASVGFCMNEAGEGSYRIDGLMNAQFTPVAAKKPTIKSTTGE